MARVGRSLVLAIVAGILSGCGLPLIAGATLNEFNAATAIVSTGLTGKGLSDHVVSLVTGRNCNLVQGAIRKERTLCERRGSAAATKDFRGVVGFVIDAATLDLKHAPPPGNDLIFANFP